MRVLVLVPALALLACNEGTMTSGDDGGVDAPPPMGRGIAADAFCGELAEIVCEANDSCCGGLAPAVPEDETPLTCRTRQIDVCRSSLEPFLRDPRTAYVPERGGAYLDGLRETAEGCFNEPPSLGLLFDVFEGTGVAEADCTPSDVNDDALMRISQASCADGLVCHLYRRSDGRPRGVCEPREDDACSHRFDCADGQWCNLPSDWEPGRWGECQPLKASGWDCADDQECASRFCDSLGTCAEPLPGRYCTARDYEHTILSDRPLAYWRLSDAASSQARDLGAYALDGTYLGASAAEGALAADFDGAMALDGVASLELPELAGRMGGNALTIEVWFRRSEASVTGPLVEFWQDDAPGVRLWNHGTASQVHVNMLDRDGTGHAITSAEGTVAADAWTHVATTYDGSTLRLYVNGEQVGEPLAESFRPDIDGVIHVGRRPDDERRIVGGAIDEIAIYDRALSAGRIRAHAAVGREGPREQTFPLLEWL